MSDPIEKAILQLQVDVRRLLQDDQQTEATALVASCLEKHINEPRVVHYVLKLLQGKHKHLALSIKSVSNEKRSNKATSEMRQEAHEMRLNGEKREVIRMLLIEKYKVSRSTIDRALTEMSEAQYFVEDDD